ncbi:MAG: LysM peptidoglycan-binding domain-containing protein [Gemmatimonadota bacterium]|nr:MAG: LysM peptidoglycan-binding domain-containing protein [Gemmatimonadota bacterium]
MRRVSILFIIILLLGGCSSTRRFIIPYSEPAGPPVISGSSEAVAVDSQDVLPNDLIQFQADLDQAELILQSSLEARQSGLYEEAQKYLDEVANLLALKDIEEIPDSLLAVRYDRILESLSREYYVVLAEVSEISVASPAWAILNRIDEFAEEGDVPACGQWVSTFSELSGQFDMEIVVNERVEKSLCFFLSQGRGAFQRWLERSGQYLEMLRAVLRDEGLPTDLVYLSMIESGFNPRAYSYAHAVGLWQFIRGTARLYGLKVDWWVDERRDPVKSTRAAAKYLKDLHRDLGDWKLAIAAYNCGKGRVDRAIRQAGTNDFWALDLPRQTENHVPIFMAAAIIAKNPGAFGFETIAYEESYTYDEVVLDHCLDLKVAATCAATTQSELKDLNPELRRWCTPVHKGGYRLKIPQGTKTQFEQAYAKIPDSKKVSWHRHKIRRGETLSQIAQHYGISQRAIMDANTISNRHRIHAGKYLLIPTPYGSSPVAAKSSTPAKSSTIPRPTAAAPKDGAVHVVRRGDTLWEIASTYDTSISKIRKWNGLKSNTIRPGDRLVVAPKKEEPLLAKVLLPTPAEADEASGEKIMYTVKRNDTLWKVSTKYGATIDQLRTWNSLDGSSIIHPGDRLVVGFRSSEGSEETNREIVYTVRRGDTLWEIAKAHKVTVSEIRRWNNLHRNSKIYPGEKFKIYIPS